MDKKNGRYTPEEVIEEAGQAILRLNNVINSMKSDMLDIINEFSNYLLERSTASGESFDQIEKDAKEFINAMNLKESKQNE